MFCHQYQLYLKMFIVNSQPSRTPLSKSSPKIDIGFIETWTFFNQSILYSGLIARHNATHQMLKLDFTRINEYREDRNSTSFRKIGSVRCLGFVNTLKYTGPSWTQAAVLVQAISNKTPDYFILLVLWAPDASQITFTCQNMTS